MHASSMYVYVCMYECIRSYLDYGQLVHQVGQGGVLATGGGGGGGGGVCRPDREVGRSRHVSSRVGRVRVAHRNGLGHGRSDGLARPCAPHTHTHTQGVMRGIKGRGGRSSMSDCVRLPACRSLAWLTGECTARFDTSAHDSSSAYSPERGWTGGWVRVASAFS